MLVDDVNPWQQGELDGLCGLYAIINAMKLLALSQKIEFTDASGAVLFRRLARYLDTRNKMPDALWDGTTYTHVKDFLAVARVFMKRQYGLDLVYRQLARKGQVVRKDVFWRFLDSALKGDGVYHFPLESSKNRVALVGLGHPLPHWTVAYRVTQRSLKLIDSGRRFTLKYVDCTLGEKQPNRWAIEPEHTFVIATL